MNFRIFDSSLGYSLNYGDDIHNTWIDINNVPASFDCLLTKNDILVKENIHSSDFIRFYMKYCNPNKNYLSHIFFMKHLDSERNFILTDGALNIEPTLQQKAQITQNALDFIYKHHQYFPRLHITCWINFLTHNGEFDLRNKLSCESQLLIDHFMRKSSEKDTFTKSCTMWQYDSCFDNYAREVKYGSDFLGWHHPTLLVVPQIDTGNVIYKSLSNEYDGYGFILGGTNPAVLNSRSQLDKNEKAILILNQ